MKVVELNSSNFRDIPATLREIANDIESGKDGEVMSMAIVSDNGEEVSVYGIGRGEINDVHFLLAIGIRKLEDMYRD